MTIKPFLQETINYSDYLRLMERLVAEGSTTGADQSKDHIYFTRLNLQRMQRIEKTTVLLPELLNALSKITKPLLWLILTESWCGDAAQNLPVLRCMEKTNPNLELGFLLRDAHLTLMDQYLTMGSRSIPKLICFEKESLKECFVWGPRPAEAQQLAMQLKQNGVSRDEKSAAIQKWYNNNKTLSVQKEFVALIETLLSVIHI